ncbi:AAA domain-containing protein [Rhodocollybia butyracea]|uniref:AAA domain-containing protein n=1 Tax=Rhodocollybia butyracea TaxID=206335 RepID=A0A9P5QBI9_9AGAR|nr:AAA domain-containing protein [Rhodocollybia butyracea]
MVAPRRLARLLQELAPPAATIGQLKLGDITYEVTEALTPSRLPSNSSWKWTEQEPEDGLETRGSYLLDPADEINAENLHFLLQKYLLGQDIFLLSQPGPYARRLALTYASLLNLEYEYVALHRDVGETELTQGREIRDGGNLVYVDSPAVNAVKYGRLLILEGIEKAERGIMPILNNLLENREMNLADGTHIISSHRYELLKERDQKFIPAHKNFRVLAIAAPVPPYPGYPLDPPFRSRFQARFIDPLAALTNLAGNCAASSSSVYQALRSVILATQYSSESRHALDLVPSAKSALPAFPQTALLKLLAISDKFPPVGACPEPSALARVLLTIHPGLVHAPFQAWALLAKQIEETGAGLELGSPSEADLGLWGYVVTSIERRNETTARISFTGPDSRSHVSHIVPCGPNPFRKFPLSNVEVGEQLLVTPRFIGLLTSFLQVHALGWDISYIPPLLPSTASTSTSTLVGIFAEVLGYDLETIHLYKELGGREIIMRRRVLADPTSTSMTTTAWEPSPLIRGAWAGKLVWLEGIDVITSTGTAGSLARFVQDREIELWEGRRVVATKDENSDDTSNLVSTVHPSFRIVTTASKSLPLRDWLSDEHANMFFTVPSRPMASSEEREILLGTKCNANVVELLLAFADKYRQRMGAGASGSDGALSGSGGNSGVWQKNRKLGTRTLVRITTRLARFPQDASQDSLRKILSHALLAEFLPTTERMVLEGLLEEVGLNGEGVEDQTTVYSQPPFIDSTVQPPILVFPEPSSTVPSSNSSSPSNSIPSPTTTVIPSFDPVKDPVGAASLVPYMDHFYDNPLQTGLMRDLAVEIEIMGEHLVLLGNQGVGKNKIIDRLCQLLRRPREYIQLHRDSTVSQLMFSTSLTNGVLIYSDSPLLRAIRFGRVMVVDEADKAPEHVVAVFRSLAARGELTLSDGRKVRRPRNVIEGQKNEEGGDIIVHKDFRLVLLANRPGYPFLGNHFLQVLGESFSPYAVSNPDQASERKLLQQMAPDMDEDMILRLVGAFADLRKGYETGKVGYPYSLRELINLVRHMRAYPADSLGDALRNVFDFDVYKPETIEKLREILDHHGLRVQHLGIDAAREAASAKGIKDVQYTPTSKDAKLGDPKEGEVDDKEHVGGNRYSGGMGGRETAGIGGRGGYKRLYKGGDIKQIPETSKRDVPEEIREKAREMARQELQRRLEELDMSAMEAKGYGQLLQATQSHMLSLFDLLEHLAAKEEERIWIKRQTDGELDDTRLTEGITGEATVYKRRTMEKPEIGRPQIKPKRIRFIFDLSASMYRFQYDGRLQRSMETAVMLMETFDRLSRKDKYVWDMCGHSGDEPVIPLVTAEQPPMDLKERWKVTEKMYMIPQYAFAGDNTVEAIQKGVDDVAKFDADDWFVITITDANFGRYQITPEEVSRAMKRHPKVHTALICIGEGADATWITKSLPGAGFRVRDTGDIPMVLRSILSSMVDK